MTSFIDVPFTCILNPLIQRAKINRQTITFLFEDEMSGWDLLARDVLVDLAISDSISKPTTTSTSQEPDNIVHMQKKKRGRRRGREGDIQREGEGYRERKTEIGEDGEGDRERERRGREVGVERGRERERKGGS